MSATKKTRKKAGKKSSKKNQGKTRKSKSKSRSAVKKNAPKEKMFVLCNGKRIKNIKELADIMEDLEEHTFNYHVNQDSNDFATWVKDVFKDIELAEKITNAKDQKHMQIILYRHITHKTW